MYDKEYFTQEQAADYACVSLRKFRDLAFMYNLQSGNFGRKKLYRKNDVQKLVEKVAFGGAR